MGLPLRRKLAQSGPAGPAECRSCGWTGSQSKDTSCCFSHGGINGPGMEASGVYVSSWMDVMTDSWMCGCGLYGAWTVKHKNCKKKNRSESCY